MTVANIATKARVAFIANDPAPYRLHVYRCIEAESTQIKPHFLFTNRLDHQSQPWGDQELPENVVPLTNALASGHHGYRQGIRLFREIRQYLVTHKIDVIVLHGYSDLVRLLLVRWANENHIPLLLSADSNVFKEGANSLIKHTIKRLYVRWVLKRISGLLPCGTCCRAYYYSFLDHRKPSFVFPFEPDYDKLLAPNEQEVADFGRAAGLPPTRRRFLFCGRLVPIKRVDLLIQAFSQIANERPDWDMVIVGDGELATQLKASVPNHLHDRVIWAGFRDTDEIRYFYRLCHALCIVSDFDAWSLVVNEAMACGLPIIATETVGAANDLVADGLNGYLVTPGNTNAIAAAMSDISQGDTAIAMGRESERLLTNWRRSHDPVAAVDNAVQHLLHYQRNVMV